MPTTQVEHRFPCAQCGASLRFEPGQARLSCEYCGHEQPIPQITDSARVTALQSLDYHDALANDLPLDQIEEMRTVHCDTCGADVQFDANIHSAECPFCASPVVTDTGTHRHIKPQAILPFRLSEADAHAQMGKWLKGLWFAPNALAKYARSSGKLSGLYLPYWAFDVATNSQYTGQRGDNYTVTVTDGDGKSRTETRTRWSRVSGRTQRQFLDLLVLASKTLPQRNTNALEPWTLADLQLYAPDYLSGFRAEGYSIPLPDGFDLAKLRMDDVIRQDVRRAIGGDEQRIDSLSTDYADERFKHLLLPVWLAAYRYRGKSYRFIVNGQTGRVQGERPYSIPKIVGAIILALAMVGLFIYVGEMGK